MSGQQHFSLRWNNHQSHVLSAFDALLQNEALVDCTLVCEDSNVKAHKVVLSACSPYFQKIFTDNPCKHPIIVLKDVRGWEVQCIVDFMYKGETSVPEAQLPSLLQAAESLKVRGLTSSERQSLPQGLILEAANRRYSPYEHEAKSSPSSQSSPISLTHHEGPGGVAIRARSPSLGAGPRRKQARPRRRSGDSVGNSSLDLSSKTADSPPSFANRKSPSNNDEEMHDVENAPENLSLKRPSSSPAINLVKTESLMEDRPTSTSSDLLHQRPKSMADYESLAKSQLAAAAAARAAANFGFRHGAGEHEARVEALQALNFMAAGGGLPSFPHPGLPNLGHHGAPPHSAAHSPSLPSHQMAAAAAAAAAAVNSSRSETRPSSTPGTPSSYADAPPGLKSGFEFQRISIDRTKMSEEEAFEHAIEMIQTRQMGFRKAADFFSVSKWKLYKTARKRGIYAEIKKQNQAQQALTKVPSNVQHFADMGVYKQLKKKTHLAKDALFPHLPTAPAGSDEVRKVYQTSNNNNNFPSMVDMHKKMFSPTAAKEADDDDELLDGEDDARARDIVDKPDMLVRPVIADVEDDDVDRVLVINHRENGTNGSTDEVSHDDDSGREDSA